METPSAEQDDDRPESDARLRGVSPEEAARVCLENSPDVLVLLDQEGVIRYLQGPVEQVLGEDAGSVLGTPAIDLIDRADRRAVRLFFRDRLEAAGEVDATSCTARRADGNPQVLSLRVQTVQFSSGERGFVCTVRDVTTQNRREGEMSRAVQEARDLSRVQAAFLRNLSHAIRTPLATIVGFAEVLVEALTGELEEYARLIFRSGRQLSETLQSAADHARLRMGDGPLDLRRVRLQRAARAIVRRFQSAGRDRGISDAFRPDIFEAFRQERAQSGGRDAGAGLGLSICRRLVENMHGRIEVQSREGHGSTFTVSLPLA